MSVNDVLDTLDELIEKSWNLPLSGGRCVIDADRFLQLIDFVRFCLLKANQFENDRIRFYSTVYRCANIVLRNRLWRDKLSAFCKEPFSVPAPDPFPAKNVYHLAGFVFFIGNGASSNMQVTTKSGFINNQHFHNRL